MTPKEAYDELVKRTQEISTLSTCQAVLEWDHQVHMPPQGAEMRARATSYLAGLIHEKTVDPKIGELLSIIEGSDIVSESDSIEAANIREMRHGYNKETKLPKELVEEFNRETALAHHVWAEARKKSDFKKFEPSLEKIIKLCNRVAEAYGYEDEPYDALLDNYEPGMTAKEVEAVFTPLRSDLVRLLEKITAARNVPDESIVERDYDVDKQKILGEMVSASMGYDYTAGRLDESTHPFTIGFGPGDTRITTRYNPKRLNDALFGTIHETGHALYEMGIDKKKHFGTPCGQSASLGIHESQSRMWENLVGRSKPFWEYYYPLVKNLFRDSLGDVSLDDFYGAINFVKPSYIRVEADEVTYSLHIMLRFELERAIMKGEIKVADIPGEWNSRFKKYFGIDVDHDAHGCLQDVHWSAGLFGYFPTYALGNIYASQFFAKAMEDISDLHDKFRRGELLPLREWLRENIHIHGQRYRAMDLCEKVTGERISAKPMLAYFEKKYSDIYGF